MANDEERLIVLLEARIRDYEKNLQKASKTTGREFGEMRRHSRSATRDMERDMVRSTSRINVALAATGRHIGALAKSMAAPLVAAGLAGGIAAIVTGTRQAVSAVADLKAQAETAGVSFGAFQELKFAAEQSKIGVDALTDGLKEMQLRADEFIDTGKGSGAEAFAQLGFHADDLARRLKEPDRLFEEIIDRLSQLDQASQIRIADEIFGGTGGEQFVRLLEDGRRGIEEARDRARELGAVLGDDVAAEAEALDQRFNEIATTLSTNMKSGVVTFADAAVAAFDRVTAAVERYQQAQNAASGGTAMGELAGGPMSRLARDLEDQARGEYDGPDGFSRADLDMTTDKTDRVEPTRARSFTPYTLPSSGSGGGGRSDAAREAERQEEATRKVIESLQDEVLMLGMSERAQRVYSEARRAGVEVGSEEYQQIQNLVDAYYAKSTALEQTAQMQRFATDLALDGVRDLTFAIDTGNQAVDRLLGSLIEAVAQAALLGEGPLASLFGGGGGFLSGIFGGGKSNLFSPSFTPNTTLGGFLGFADGTANTGGRRGEPRGIVHGQEAVIPLPDGGRVPVHIQAPASASARQEIILHVMAEEGPMFRPTIRAESENVAVKINQANNKRREKSWQGGGNPR